MEAKNDCRFFKTRRALIMAFKDLLVNRPLRDISILELTERAGISRRTFYAHYSTFDAFLEDLVLSQVDETLPHLMSLSDGPFHIDFHTFFRNLTEALKKDQHVYSRMMADQYCMDILLRRLTDIEDFIVETYSFLFSIRKDQLRLCLHFYIIGAADAYSTWFSKSEVPLDDFADAMDALFRSVFNSSLMKTGTERPASPAPSPGH